MIAAHRAFLGLCALALAAAPALAEVGEDGLHKEPWFKVSFKDMAEDVREAAAHGKRVAIVFEQRGCIYCAELHEKVLSDPGIAEYISTNFDVIQMNLFGDEEVTDFDGEAMSEKEMARKWRVVFTPTILFLPESAPDGVSVVDAAVANMPGAFGKKTTLHMFQWVREKGYEGEEHFQKYHARKLAEGGATTE